MAPATPLSPPAIHTITTHVTHFKVQENSRKFKNCDKDQNFMILTLEKHDFEIKGFLIMFLGV